MWNVHPDTTQTDDNLIVKYAPEKPYVSLDHLAGQSLLWFIDSDFAIDYPRPIMPNEIMVGGLTTRPQQPLPADLEKLLTEAEHGVIVIIISTGALKTALPKYVVNHMMSALSKLKQVVI